MLGLATQAYYTWCSRPVSDRDWDDAHTINALIDAHADDPAFGYRLLADELERAGIPAGERRVWRLCRSRSCGRPPPAKAARASGRGQRCTMTCCTVISPPSAPNRKWVTDITEHPTAGEGKLYCCAIKDLFSNRIVGYAVADRMTADLAAGALRAAIARRRPRGGLVHSDHDGQFRSRTSKPCSTPPGCTDRWAASPPLVTTPRWRGSARCYNGTSTNSPRGDPAPSCTTRSCTGSSTPTTAAAANDARQTHPGRIRASLHPHHRSGSRLTGTTGIKQTDSKPDSLCCNRLRSSSTWPDPSFRRRKSAEEEWQEQACSWGTCSLQRRSSPRSYSSLG